ncbi:DUF6879 family protein [Streptomonospora algeriensis]|uniref:DUF6879 family protein n=1 Tax=Streptomonospora algeriensis TaxID=995084 RepID=A0ABW3BFP8_9ACTN
MGSARSARPRRCRSAARSEVYGTRALYQVRYDGVWTPIGAKRVDDPELVAGAAAAIAELWERSEPFSDYFDREIAPLPPPKVDRGGRK